MNKRDKEREAMILDACREIGNIGTGSAITVLSHMIRDKIEEMIPTAARLGTGELMKSLGNAEERVYGILFPLYGDLEGVFGYIIKEPMVEEILAGLDIKRISMEKEEDRIVLLKEITSIMTSAYLKAISDFMDVKIRIHEPAIAFDMVGSMIIDVGALIARLGQESMGILGGFSIGEIKDGCRTCMMLYQKTSDDFCKALGLE